MTTDYALINRKARVRSGVTTADATDPTTSSTYTNTKGCSYIEININGLTGLQVCKIRPYFYEIVDNSGTQINYISFGAEIETSLEKGVTCNIPGVNGRPVYIKVTELTAGSTVDIDIAPGRVPPGLNI